MLTLDECQKIIVLTRLKAMKGNRTKAAQSLGVARSSLQRWLYNWSEVKSRPHRS